MNVVISQSMYFPWVGLLEQVRLANVFVHYDDVQLTRGFYNRVQVKTAQGMRWLTVPLREHHRGQRIDEALVDERTDWRSRHRDVLRQASLNAPYRDEMLHVLDQALGRPASTLAEVSRASMLALADYFGLREGRRFVDAAALGIGGRSSQRLHDIANALGGRVYITGHGARNYLDHALFEHSGIDVRYMQYRCLPYPQAHGAFTPYLTALDLIAQCGRAGAAHICSGTVSWRSFINEPQQPK